MTTEYEKNCSAGSALTTERVDNYFSQLNPIAERIAKAISDTKTTYGMLWYKLDANDQDEIINETLINPEITLQYIDSLSAKISVSSSSLDFSTPVSLTDNVMKDFNQMNITDVQQTKGKESKKLFTTNNQQYYGFDGRSLSTFAVHRVAQKLLKDDTLADAGYRDEHSAPFSYRTRSQINFHLHNNNNNTLEATVNKDKEFMLPLNKTKIINDKKIATKNLVNATKKPKRVAPQQPTHELKSAPALSKDEQNVHKNKVQKTDLPVPNLSTNYLKYSSVQDEVGENSSLIAHRQEGDALLSSSQLSNTTLSDEDEHEYYNEDSQNQMEEAKLLDTDVSLKRGFEFLNNW